MFSSCVISALSVKQASFIFPFIDEQTEAARNLVTSSRSLTELVNGLGFQSVSFSKGLRSSLYHHSPKFHLSIRRDQLLGEGR